MISSTHERRIESFFAHFVFVSTFRSCLPTDEDFDNLDQYEITSPHEWDPSQFTPDVHTYRTQREYHLDNAPDDTDVFHDAMEYAVQLNNTLTTLKCDDSTDSDPG